MTKRDRIAPERAGRAAAARLVLACLVGLLGALGAARAQTVPAIPYDAAVDSLFQAGVRHFEAGAYDLAHQAFSRVHAGRNLNRRTTAALLMDGKALYADSASVDAAAVLRRLLDEYPESRYAAAARETLGRAEAEVDRVRRMEQGLFTLGILLPLGSGDAPYSRSIVRGIRLAVEEHNASEPRNPVRMVFRPSGGQEDGVQGVVRSMKVDDGVEAIIGPLYSEEAVAAGRQADREEVVLLVPLATDAAVAAGRRYVYQANPTFGMRGRLMAQYALQRLRYQRVGVLVEQGTAAEQFAQGFASEAARLTGASPYYAALSGMQAWYQLKTQIPEDTLLALDALYVPFTGSSAAARITAALEGIDQFSDDLQVFGNGEWHGRSDAGRLARHRVVYTKSYFVDEDAPAVRDFVDRYRAAYDGAPNEQAYVGYDVARYLLLQLDAASSKTGLREAIGQSGAYEGLAGVIDFSRGNVNDAVHFLQVVPEGVRPID